MSYIVELFSGIQGEGPIVGYRQIFVRFAQCQLDCKYCDTNFQQQPYASIELQPGSRSFEKWENPVSSDRLIAHIKTMLQHLSHHSVSLTGGEPLLHCQYLRELSTGLRDENVLIYLETNGLLYEQLSSVIDVIDIIGMDMKLESSTGEVTRWEEHEKFLEIAKQKDVFVKLIVSADTTEEEILKAAEIICRQDQSIPLILQPVTPTNGLYPPTPDRLLVLMETAMKHLSHVRVIPQTHVMLQQL